MKTQSSKEQTKAYLAEKYMAFGENMRIARKNKGIAAKDLAAFLGLSITYIGLIERGERTPSFEVFLRICDILGESSDKLLTPDAFGLSSKANKVIDNDMHSETAAAKRKVASGMLGTFSVSELEFVIKFITNFKAYCKKTNKEN